MGLAARGRRGGVAAARAAGGGVAGPVLVAGGGIGGLAVALALCSRGIPCKIFEKVKKYEPFGGPIQLGSNALATLEAINPDVAAQIMEEGIVTGDRVNGLLDGKTGEWYSRFDTREPARKYGLPLTLVINRYRLLDILREALPEGACEMGQVAESYENLPGGRAALNFVGGRREEGSLVVAADGIRSALRKQMKGDLPTYSGYSCYTATCDFESEDVDTVGYQVYLGYQQYFVASDVGAGQTQFYAFCKRDAGGEDREQCMKEELLDFFGNWCPGVLDRIQATRPEDIECRDIFDHRPTLSWADGSVCLAGDSAHAMQPNLGQGGCQAIEDAYVLSTELERLQGGELGSMGEVMRNYQWRRVARAAAIIGLARSAALMTTTWRPYLGSDPYDFYGKVPGALDFWKGVENLKIPHPGKVAGQVAVMGTMSSILEYVAAAHPVPTSVRAPQCQIPGITAPDRNVPREAFAMKGIPGFAR